jgi:hypothetical protein
VFVDATPQHRPAFDDAALLQVSEAKEFHLVGSCAFGATYLRRCQRIVVMNVSGDLFITATGLMR